MYKDNKVNHEKLIKFLNENSDFTKLEKDNTLKEAVEKGNSLPLKPIDMKYWPDYLSKNS